MHAEFIRWKNRSALMLTNGSLQVVVLAGGGHLAELRILSAGAPSPNLLWESPWQTADPESAEVVELGARYGGVPAGPFLAGYTGHAICLDIFGPPSTEESAGGIPLHGEASTAMWKLVPAVDGCVAHVRLPVARLSFTRAVRMAKDQCILLIEECLENTGPDTREVHWVQHVSLGPPFLSREASIVEASVDRCRTWPEGYEGGPLLPDSVDFAWPSAPTVDGGTTDLRLPFQHQGTGFLAAARVAQASTIAWIAALNPVAGCALVYCFRRDQFPWVAIWEENGARRSPPWNGGTRVRGMEFGTTPMPLGREAIHSMGTLFDTSVSVSLRPGEKRYARYAIAAAAIPRQLRAVDAVRVSESAITLTNSGRTAPVVIAADGIQEFLTEGHNAV